jgi:hypothetical protein
LKFCNPAEQAAYIGSANSLRRRQGQSSDAIATSNNKSARIVDIQTEPDFYTEVFSWGNDEFG